VVEILFNREGAKGAKKKLAVKNNSSKEFPDHRSTLAIQ
jgi:hypothetical protein